MGSPQPEWPTDYTLIRTYSVYSASGNSKPIYTMGVYKPKK